MRLWNGKKASRAHPDVAPVGSDRQGDNENYEPSRETLRSLPRRRSSSQRRRAEENGGTGPRLAGGAGTSSREAVHLPRFQVGACIRKPGRSSSGTGGASSRPVSLLGQGGREDLDS